LGGPLEVTVGGSRPRQTLGRLARSADIRAVLRRGRGYSCPAGILKVGKGGSDRHRLCVIVSRKVGKAVVRNRIRRRVREIARREINHDVRPVDVTFRALPPAADLGFGALRESVVGLMVEAGLVAEPDSAQWR